MVGQKAVFEDSESQLEKMVDEIPANGWTIENGEAHPLPLDDDILYTDDELEQEVYEDEADYEEDEGHGNDLEDSGVRGIYEDEESFDDEPAYDCDFDLEMELMREKALPEAVDGILEGIYSSYPEHTISKFADGKMSEVRKVTFKNEEGNEFQTIYKTEDGDFELKLEDLGSFLLDNSGRTKVVTYNFHEEGIDLSFGTTLRQMECAPGYSLKQILEQGKISYGGRIQIAYSLLQAVDKLHRQGIIHRDLKPENMFVDYDPKKKKVRQLSLIDLDMGMKMPEGQEVVEIPVGNNWLINGNVRYMSLEQTVGKHSFKADDYAVGRIITELLMSPQDYKKIEEPDNPHHGITFKSTYNKKDGISDEQKMTYKIQDERLAKMCFRMLNEKPENRMTGFQATKALERKIGSRKLNKMKVVNGGMGVDEVRDMLKAYEPSFNAVVEADLDPLKKDNLFTRIAKYFGRLMGKDYGFELRDAEYRLGQHMIANVSDKLSTIYHETKLVGLDDFLTEMNQFGKLNLTKTQNLTHLKKYTAFLADYESFLGLLKSDKEFCDSLDSVNAVEDYIHSGKRNLGQLHNLIKEAKDDVEFHEKMDLSIKLEKYETPIYEQMSRIQAKKYMTMVKNVAGVENSEEMTNKETSNYLATLKDMTEYQKLCKYVTANMKDLVNVEEYVQRAIVKPMNNYLEGVYNNQSAKYAELAREKLSRNIESLKDICQFYDKFTSYTKDYHQSQNANLSYVGGMKRIIESYDLSTGLPKESQPSENGRTYPTGAWDVLLKPLEEEIQVALDSGKDNPDIQRQISSSMSALNHLHGVLKQDQQQKKVV